MLPPLMALCQYSVLRDIPRPETVMSHACALDTRDVTTLPPLGALCVSSSMVYDQMATWPISTPYQTRKKSKPVQRSEKICLTHRCFVFFMIFWSNFHTWHRCPLQEHVLPQLSTQQPFNCDGYILRYSISNSQICVHAKTHLIGPEWPRWGPKNIELNIKIKIVF